MLINTVRYFNDRDTWEYPPTRVRSDTLTYATCHNEIIRGRNNLPASIRR